MSSPSPNRRDFLSASLAAAGAVAVSAARRSLPASDTERLHLSTNVYPWYTFFRREGKDFQSDLEASLAAVAASGMDGFETIAESPATIDQLVPLLQKNQLQMRSFYVNSVLHDAASAAESSRNIVSIARRAKDELGTRIVVTNPSPLRWGGPDNKDDAQLRTQADALNRLGEQLRQHGLTLAYHNHDMELRMAAREFHHMLVGTDPQNVTLCLDAHWIYRGSGNSSVALFDVLALYGPRISELHLRQSRAGIWTEALGEGDIDYPALAAHLRKLGIRPHLVLEQAVEEGTPHTLDAVEAHRRSREYAATVFAGVGQS